MSQSNKTPHTPMDTTDLFEERLRRLLAQTANDVRPSPGFARQVRRRALAGDFISGSRPAFSVLAALRALKPLGSVALVMLVVGALAFLLVGPGVAGLHLPSLSPLGAQPGGTSSTRDCSSGANAPSSGPETGPKPLDNSTAYGLSASHDGVTLTLDRAYVDATQTAIAYHVTLAPGVKLASDIIGLTDAAGTRYLPNDGFGPDAGSSHSPYGGQLFAPLPQSELGAPQHLTLTLTHLATFPANATPPTGVSTRGTEIPGTWAIPFTITPVAGTAIPLSAPAQTHDGITIQPLELDIVPPGGGLSGEDGGARVLYRVSGAPPTMLISALTQFAFSFVEHAGSGDGYTAGPCGEPMTLRLPSGKTILPGILVAPQQYVPTDNTDAEMNKMGSQSVGPSGAAEGEALFFAPIQPGAGALTLTIERFRIVEGDNMHVHTTRVANGPWVFNLPLQP